VKIGMIVLAGGIGKRIGRPFPKQFLLLGGKPLIVHVLEKARVIADIDRVVITCPDAHLDETRRLLANHGFDARFSCILGGVAKSSAGSALPVVRYHREDRRVTQRFAAVAAGPERCSASIPFTVLKGHEYVEDLLVQDERSTCSFPEFDRVAAAAHRRLDADTFFTETPACSSATREKSGSPDRAEHQDRHRDRRGIMRRHGPRG
jgi:2-C-methyl-D-erythritol 4-phosphate cytidylyltransferase